MQPLALLLALAGCDRADPAPPAVPDAPPRPFHERAAPAAVRLLGATADAIALPPGDALPEVEGTWSLGPVPASALLDETDRRGFAFPVPFPLPEDDGRFRPEGVQVLVDGAPVPYDMSPFARRHLGWKVRRGELIVSVPGTPDALAITVVNEALRARAARQDPATSGLSAAQYVSWTHVHGDESRAGLLLPASSEATWTVEIPAGGRFEAWVDLVPRAVADDGRDAARVSLAVDGVEVAARRVHRGGGWWRREVLGARDPGPWAVDLSPWAGQRVAVALRVEEDGEPGSLAFLGGPAVIGAPEAPPRRVVVLAVDTLRPDHLGAHGYARDTSPELDALAARSVVFERAWAPAPRTRPSFRSATTGRGALDAVGAPTLGEVFAAEGFATAGIVANIHLNHRFGFDRGYDWWRLDTAARAGDQVDAALAWLGANAHRDTFLFLHIMDPHLFYDPPPPYDTAFVAAPDPTLPPSFNRWGVLGWIARDEVTEARAAHVTGLYDGEIAYTSAQIGRLVEGIDALPGTTALVFHTDHGEELFEHGGFEHNHALWEEVVRAALWIRLPPPHEATALRSEEPVALWDIAPTLYELAGVGSPPPSDGRSLLPLALGADPGGWDRPLPIGHLMYDVEQWGVVWRGHKYAIETTSGRERLYDLAADPGERVDLAAGADLAPFREALGRAHGMPVGPGWRIAIDLRGQEPLEWILPAPARAAGVIDPEAGRTNRANQAWGERPALRPEDVATVELLDEGQRLRITPGPEAKGDLFVLFGALPEGTGELSRGREVLRTWALDDGLRVRGTLTTLHAVEGTVLAPPPGEATRMAALDQADSDDLSLLEALGYVGGEAH